MKMIDLKQGSAEWLQARVGKCTGSRVADALSFLKKGAPSQKRKDYLTEVVTERLTGFAVDHYVSPAMDWGTDNEKYARAAYEVVSGNDVDIVGIAEHPTIADFSSSPDGYVGEDGIVELKCPNTTTHIGYLLANEVPEAYLFQCWAEMACSGRKWVDFVSFDPRLPPKNQIFIKRLERNKEMITMVEQGVVLFLSEVEAMVAQLGGPRERVEALEPQDDGLGISDADLPQWYREMA